MLKSPCTRLKAELYNAAGFFGPLSPGPSLDIIDIPKWFTQVSSTTAFSESHSCKATLSQQDQQKYSQCTRWYYGFLRVRGKKKSLHSFRTRRRGHGTGVGVISLCLYSRENLFKFTQVKCVAFFSYLSPPDHWKIRRLLTQEKETFYNVLKAKRVLQ